MARGVRIGDYQLEQELAVSPVSFLYRAQHSVLPRRALLKVSRETTTRVDVLREACLLAALSHPGVVRVYETGRMSDQRTWFAYEDVEGMTLADAFDGGPDSALGAIAAEVAVGMIRDVAEILAYAHQRGVIHCAIAPERLVVARGRGFPICVTDWSAARAHDAETAPAADLVAYTAPELATGEPIDDRVDVWALGVIAYRAVTGRMPFDAAVTTPVTGLFVPAEVHCPTAPRELAMLIDSMLAFDRWDRPTAAEVRGQLAILAAHLEGAPPEPVDAPIELRIRKPRWTPQIDLGTKLRADTELESSLIVTDETDPS
jgi:serine/threonine-protein kinase